MPVKFKGSSEYKQKYNWVDSKRSSTFQPTSEQTSPMAGLNSGELGIQIEPPLQRRKKPIEIPVTSTTKFVDKTERDDYTLIGQQDKFAPSIKYKNRVKENVRPVPALAEAYKAETSPKSKEAKKPVYRQPPKSKFSQKSPKDRKDKRPGVMNEIVQTNLDKGVADAAQEAPADYAMKYKAGVAAKRPVGPKRVSEYQKEFAWKDTVKDSSPLLAAEQVVYNNNPHMGPFKADAGPKQSEYKREYKPWHLVRFEPHSHFQDPNGETPKKKSKMKRSKSEPNLTPDKKKPAGTEAVTANYDPRLLREGANPQKPFFPHGKHQRYRSEYKSNFHSPGKFSYREGAWSKAAPPHLQPRKDSDNDLAKAEKSLSNWYQEVIELRNKAQEYRRRAQGTHFSREHLAQLWARQADLWDSVSSSSSLSALSLEPTDATKSKPKKKSPGGKYDKKGDEGHVSPARRRLAWDSESDRRSTSTASMQGTSGVVSLASSVKSIGDNSSSMSQEISDTDTLVTDEGRPPTPEVKGKVVFRRHHLDVTTPSVGGALLTSPNVPKTKVQPPPASRPSQPRKGKTYKVTGDSDDVSSECSSSTPPARTPPAAKVPIDRCTPPTYGMPTRDTHLLIDDESPYDKPLETKYVHSPNMKAKTAQGARRDRPNSGSQRGQPRALEKLDEGMGKTYNKPGALESSYIEDDDDILSVSARSVASSCSLASEVLDRARQRRDEFWQHSSRQQAR